jgi:hypothetical protein
MKILSLLLQQIAGISTIIRMQYRPSNVLCLLGVALKGDDLVILVQQGIVVFSERNKS